MNLDLKIILPVVIAFCISVVLCPIVIPFLKKLKFGQFVRDDGPQAHLKKAGTPTMGGLIILLSFTITTLIYMKDYPDVLPVLFVTPASCFEPLPDPAEGIDIGKDSSL